MHVHAADKMGNRRAKVLALLTGNFQRRNSNHKHLMDGETDPQSDAQLKGDAKDQQLDVQLMDGEADPQLGVQLEAMGFASFGQKHKRPKHHHGGSSLESVPTSLPKKPLASISSPTEAGQVPVNNQAKEVGLTKSQVSYSIAVKLFSIDFVSCSRTGKGFSGQSRPLGNNPSASHDGGSSQSYYSRSFVDNPWEALERRMGIFVGKKN